MDPFFGSAQRFGFRYLKDHKPLTRGTLGKPQSFNLPRTPQLPSLLASGLWQVFSDSSSRKSQSPFYGPLIWAFSLESLSPTRQGPTPQIPRRKGKAHIAGTQEIPRRTRRASSLFLSRTLSLNMQVPLHIEVLGPRALLLKLFKLRNLIYKACGARGCPAPGSKFE